MIDPRWLHREHFAIQEGQSTEGLLMGARACATLNQIVEESAEVFGPEVARMTALVKPNERANPVRVGTLRARAVVELPKLRM